MKITIWIRAAKDNPRDITLRLDTKYESYDTPNVARYGNKLAKAIEGTAEKEEAK
jgi:hypothetical protein